MRLSHLVILLLVAGCVGGGSESPGLKRALATGDLAAVERAIDQEFPGVREITSADLESRLNDPSLLLLDARAVDEFTVSHLPGAKRAEPDGTTALTVPKDTPIVVYCSVGLRSAKLARQLTADDYTNVANLRGSIFRWAIDGRPLEADGETVNVVHPYNATWSRLLPPRLRAAL